ncbi:MAG: N-acetylneuraminate synthase family protein [Candidatus Omnitrophota bacterium]
MKIGDFVIGEKTFIVAEIAGNHNGSLETAKKLIKSAKEAGADAVKFQTYQAEKYIDKNEPALALVSKFFKTQQERYKSLQFSPKQWEMLINLCGELEIMFFSTPADQDSVDFLAPYVCAYKIQSGDVTNIPLIRQVVKKGKVVIMSTGMASEDELETAVKEVPEDRLVLLHCVSIYPTPADKTGLLSIAYLQNKFNVPVGYSDHSLNSLACLAAVACGAVIIERHFTNDKNQEIGDHRFSADADEFKRMVKDIREIEKMMTGFDQRLTESELKMRYMLRRSLVLTADAGKGTVLTEQMLMPLRPEKGISSRKIDYVVGKRTTRDLWSGQFITEKDIA